MKDIVRARSFATRLFSVIAFAQSCQMGDLVSPFWSLGGPSWHLEGVLGDHGGSMKDMGRVTVGFFGDSGIMSGHHFESSADHKQSVFSRLFPCLFLYSFFIRNLDSWAFQNKGCVLEVFRFFGFFRGCRLPPKKWSVLCFSDAPGTVYCFLLFWGQH